MITKNDAVRKTVREGYGEIAKSGSSCCGPSSTCGSSADEFAESIGYEKEELASIPAGANLGLSCGNPTALASLREGDVVLDLGSGAGFDVFIAAGKVGASGRVIGVDMTPEMLERARRNAAGFDNVEFRLGEIEHLPVADQGVDVVISNCVINLSPDKAQVWREIARVLKPGGRACISDMALVNELPDFVKESAESLVGCVSGAITIDETRKMVEAAGLVDATFEAKGAVVDAMMENVSDPLYKEGVKMIPDGMKASDFVTSLSVTAQKPQV
ncbi:MAG: arsenite methyltransferase [Planctomycetes bacterium]|nr:arsenite methyltransferase [Planctomycetota bacterium]